MSSTREDDTDNNIYYRVHVILFLGANRNPGENFKTSNCFHFNSKTLAIIQVHFLKQSVRSVKTPVVPNLTLFIF